jgi:hypothetical protein
MKGRDPAAEAKSSRQARKPPIRAVARMLLCLSSSRGREWALAPFLVDDVAGSILAGPGVPLDGLGAAPRVRINAAARGVRPLAGRPRLSSAGAVPPPPVDPGLLAPVPPAAGRSSSPRPRRSSARRSASRGAWRDGQEPCSPRSPRRARRGVSAPRRLARDGGALRPLLAAVARARTDLAPMLAPLVPGAAERPVEETLLHLRHALSLPLPPLLLLVDEADRATGDAATAMLARIAAAPSVRGRLLLAARDALPLPAERMELAGQLVRLPAERLALDATELRHSSRRSAAWRSTRRRPRLLATPAGGSTRPPLAASRAVFRARARPRPPARPEGGPRPGEPRARTARPPLPHRRRRPRLAALLDGSRLRPRRGGTRVRRRRAPPPGPRDDLEAAGARSRGSGRNAAGMLSPAPSASATATERLPDG